MSDTRRVANDTPTPDPAPASVGRRRIVVSAIGRMAANAVAAITAVLAVSCASSGRRSSAPVVLWTADGRAVIATPDTVALAPGARVTFVVRGDTLARGTVARLHGGALAIAELSSGSLAHARLDRVRVIAALPAPLGPLRVGIPREGRMNPRLRTEGRAREALNAAWPDSVQVRAFDLADDEEIAFERGDLDVAVFGPGELSGRLRTVAGSGLLWGTRTRGVIVAEWLDPEDSTAVRPRLDLDAMNRTFFRGDLAPWRAPATPVGVAGAARGAAVAGATAAGPWFIVDATWPGREDLERFLNRGVDPRARTVRLSLLDVPVAAPELLALDVADRLVSSVRAPWAHARADTLRAAIRRALSRGETITAERIDGALEALGVTPLYVIRCPLVCRPGWRARVAPLADVLVNISQ